MFNQIVNSLNLQHHILPGAQTYNFLIRLKTDTDYDNFTKLYKSLHFFIVKQKTQKIRSNTLIDLILSDIIFK